MSSIIHSIDVTWIDKHEDKHEEGDAPKKDNSTSRSEKMRRNDAEDKGS